MIEDILKDSQDRMNKSIDALKNELAKLRTGRANPALLDHIQVDYYGSMTPLNQVAGVVVEDARTLSIKPWEKALVGVIEKALLGSDLGLNPSSTGDVIRVPLPALTEERRKDMIRIVRDEGEKARVAIRNVRRDANSSLKALVKDKVLSEDDERRGQTRVQSITDDFIALVDETLAAKEKELMTI